jgi:DNA-binding IclR family transcriptional regulator
MLADALDADASAHPKTMAGLVRSAANQPHRQKLLLAAQRVRATRTRDADLAYRSPDELLADIRLSRGRGYAVDNGEQEVGVRCYAVPVEGLAVPCAISVSGPQARMLGEHASRMVGALRETAAVLRTATGLGG